MAPKFALFTKGTTLPLNQGFQNRFLVTTVSHQALDLFMIIVSTISHNDTSAADAFKNISG